jgi:hypothetical protein
MATRKKPAARKAPATLAGLLAKELTGEAAASEQDLALMMQASVGVTVVQPWLSLSDSNYYAFDSDSGQRWYCVVMGAGGEVFGIQAYRGDAGFALLDDIQNENLPDSADFIARQDLLTIEFVRRSELTPLDRALLAIYPHALPLGVLVPQIRVSRPGELPWYPNADDVAEINDCLMASILFYEWLAKHPSTDPWAVDGELPFLTNWATEIGVKAIRHPVRPAPARPAPSKMDERRVNQLLAVVPKRQVGHPIEVDVFILRSPMRDGGRPYFPWMALATDSSSGFLFPPVIAGTGRKREDMLIDCALGALEASPFRPLAYHVRDEFCLLALEPLATAFDIPVKVKDLPAIAEAREAMEARMGR